MYRPVVKDDFQASNRPLIGTKGIDTARRILCLAILFFVYGFPNVRAISLNGGAMPATADDAVLSDDCDRMYFFGLDSVFYQKRVR